MPKPKYTDLPVDKIQLDLSNPRIAQWMEMYKNPTSEDIALALGVRESSTGEATTTYTSLKESIKTNKGLIHPIIVNKQSDGNHVVIEGNTRVAIIREFRDDEIDGDWNTVPSMVYDSLDQEIIDAIRLQAHLVGPRQWRPYAKAKYLFSLRNESHLTLEQIVDFCGGRKSEVNSYINAYSDIEKYYRPLCDDSEFDPTRFSAFVELQKPIIQTALVNNGFNKTDFSTWIKELKIRRLEKVRALPRVLNNSNAKDIFLRSNIEEAIRSLDVTTQGENVLSDATIFQLAKEISVKIGNIVWAEVQSLKEDIGAENVEYLFNAKDNLHSLCKDIESD
ncbi:MAG: hypothetical protein CMN79_02500 [Spirochaetales bacterium]|nr:hypothetical protein [Spirochaetales bacterium]|tara:strand:+ start:877 stop:1881 length:1005 start_codon:yes stop_codon:yes gene_type:complete